MIKLVTLDGMDYSQLFLRCVRSANHRSGYGLVRFKDAFDTTTDGSTEVLYARKLACGEALTVQLGGRHEWMEFRYFFLDLATNVESAGETCGTSRR